MFSLSSSLTRAFLSHATQEPDAQRKRWCAAYLTRVIEEGVQFCSMVISLIDRYRYDMFPIFIDRWRLIFKRYRFDALMMMPPAAADQQLLARELAEIKEGHEALLLEVMQRGSLLQQCEVVSTTSVFLYERLGEEQAAIELAESFFTGSLERLDELPEDGYKPITSLLMMIRDNVNVWRDG